MGIARKYRLNSRKLFKMVYEEGKVLKSRLFVVYFVPIDKGPKVAIVVSKKFGKAVRRNKLKRRIREIIRRHLPLLSHAVIVLPRMKAKNVSFWDLKKDLDRLLSAIEKWDVEYEGF